MNVEVKRWGNSLAVRIPKDLVQTLGLSDGSRLSLEVKDGELVLRPADLELEGLLRAFEAYGPNPHGETDWGEDVGGERV